MDLNLDQHVCPQLNVTLGGEVYKIRRPKAIEIKKYQAAAQKKGNDPLDVTIDFISTLGMPRDIVEELDVLQLEALIDALSPKKKG